jgi:hypothetical protein
VAVPGPKRSSTASRFFDSSFEDGVVSGNQAMAYQAMA